MDLPPELFRMVGRLFTKAELKDVRLTCKAFDRAVVPLLFDEIFLSTNRADFDIAHLIIRHFSPYVRTLVFSSVYYPVMSWTKFNSKTRLQRAERGRYKYGNMHVQQEHLRYGYRNYCQLQREQKVDVELGVCLAHLCRALKSLPILQKLVLTDGRSPMGDQMRGRGHWKIQELCPVPGCALSDDGHLEFQLLPESGFSSIITNPWDLAMLAMWTTGFTFKDIAIEPYQYAHGPQIDILNPVTDADSMFEFPYDSCQYFVNLAKFRLRVDCSQLSSNFQWEDAMEVLSAATNLKSLYLENMDRGPSLDSSSTKLGTLVEYCKFPKLRSLILTGLDSTTDQLLQLFQASPQLTQLTLHKHTLTSGTWEIVADSIYGLSSLHSVELDQLFGGWPENSKTSLDSHFGCYYDYFGCVEAFLFDGGQNPFSVKALDDWRRKKNTRARRFRNGVLGPEKRYELFH